MFIRAFIIGLVVSTLALGGEPDPKSLQALMLKLIQETQVVAVPELSGPASEFKEDGDPNTLQIVFLARKEDGPSRVTDDGEVVFLYKASDNEQQTLITKAFEIRARQRLGAL